MIDKGFVPDKSGGSVFVLDGDENPYEGTVAECTFDVLILPLKSTHKVKQHYELKLVYFSFQTQPEINIPKTNEVFFCCN